MARKKRSAGFDPVKRPGAATRKARSAGMSLHEWEEKHKNDKGRTGRQARFPLIAAKWSHKGKKSKKTTRKRVSMKA